MCRIEMALELQAMLGSNEMHLKSGSSATELVPVAAKSLNAGQHSAS